MNPLLPKVKTVVLDTLEHLSDPRPDVQELGRTLYVCHNIIEEIQPTPEEQEEYDLLQLLFVTAGYIHHFRSAHPDWEGLYGGMVVEDGP